MNECERRRDSSDSSDRVLQSSTDSFHSWIRALQSLFGECGWKWNSRDSWHRICSSTQTSRFGFRKCRRETRHRLGSGPLVTDLSLVGRRSRRSTKSIRCRPNTWRPDPLLIESVGSVSARKSFISLTVENWDDSDDFSHSKYRIVWLSARNQIKRFRFLHFIFLMRRINLLVLKTASLLSELKPRATITYRIILSGFASIALWLVNHITQVVVFTL